MKELIYLSDEFKRKVVQEVLSGSLTKQEARFKYGIKGKSAVLTWIRKFGEGIYHVESHHRPFMPEKPKNEKELLARIKKLEQELEDARLKAEAYAKMIEIAERDLNISIRKKSNTKQSGK